MIIHMLTVKIVGIIFISLCPAMIAMYVYLGMIKRINELEKLYNFVLNIKQYIELKSLYTLKANVKFSTLLADEKSSLDNLLNECSVSNSEILINTCDIFLNLIKRRREQAEEDFSKRGKVTAATGICLGITIFILAI